MNIRTVILRNVFLWMFVSALSLFLWSCKERQLLTLRPSGMIDIITGDSADSLTLVAAEEFKEYFEAITHREIVTRSSDNEASVKVYVGTAGVNDTSVINSISNLPEEGFVITAVDGTLILAGNNGLADLYAVHTFLEQYAGVMRFTAEEELVPPAKKIRVPFGTRVYEPAFSFRVAHFPDRDKQPFVLWNKTSTFDNWGLFVHTFQTLMPAAEYFDKHPEYFSLVNGKRIQDGQLCLSNPEVINVLTENLASLIDKNPGRKYWSVSQNDCINYCECDNCKKLYEKYGSISGAYVDMANQIARRFPDKVISTLAYQFTRQAPTGIKPDPNVNIMFCSIECNRSMPLADDPRSRDFVKDLTDWSNITNNIFMWDYVVQFKTYLCPFPNFSVLQPNIQLFRDHKIPMMFQQGSGQSWSDLAELKQYLIAKLLWDPDIDADSVINRFIKGYYGNAAPYIREYYDLTNRQLALVADHQNLDIYGLPSYYFGSFLSRDMLVRYNDLMNRAEKAVANDSIYLKRVLRARIAPDFAYLDYALNAGDSTLSFVVTTASGKQVNDELVRKLDRTVENGRLTGATAVAEHNYSLYDYRDHVKRIITMASRENKLRPADFRPVTPINPRYASMGAGALADGIFGGRTFSSGWLGYEAEDMVLEIKPEGNPTISRISMNFLCDHVSWIFLPSEITIEVSTDGNSFRTVGYEKNEVTKLDPSSYPVYKSFEFDPVKVNTIRVTAVSLKRCPSWHRGAGLPSWIFIDEIVAD